MAEIKGKLDIDKTEHKSVQLHEYKFIEEKTKKKSSSIEVSGSKS